MSVTTVCQEEKNSACGGGFVGEHDNIFGDGRKSSSPCRGVFWGTCLNCDLGDWCDLMNGCLNQDLWDSLHI